MGNAMVMKPIARIATGNLWILSVCFPRFLLTQGPRLFAFSAYSPSFNSAQDDALSPTHTNPGPRTLRALARACAFPWFLALLRI